MDIKSFLLELIANQKTVGLHALGTLYKKKTPGRYDSVTHSFLPPKQEIAFTTDVSEDSSLANFISEKKNISIESATYYVNEFVDNIHAQLSDHQYADFSPFGELRTVDDKIVLESSKSLDYSFDFYGLPNVPATLETENPESDNIHSEEEKDIGIPTENFEHQELDIAASEEPEEPISDEIAHVNAVQERNEQEERVDIEPSISDPLWKPTVIHRYEYDDEEDEDENSGRWIRVLLKAIFTMLIIFAIAGTLIYYFYPDLFYTIKGSFSESAVEESVPMLRTDSSSVSSPDTTLIDTIKPGTTVQNNDTLTTKTPENTVVYEVIGSAMKTQKKADEIISILSKRGINAKKVDAMPGRRIKISLGSFTDFSLAKKFQDSLKIKLRNPEIYIQTIKPKN